MVKVSHLDVGNPKIEVMPAAGPGLSIYSPPAGLDVVEARRAPQSAQVAAACGCGAGVGLIWPLYPHC